MDNQTAPKETTIRNAKTTTYELFQPITSGPERIATGRTLSRHRTPRTARAHLDTATRRLTRRPGQRDSWLDWMVRAVEAGRRRELTAGEWAEWVANEEEG